MSFVPSPRVIVAAFERVESTLGAFLANVPLVQEHLSVWSPVLVGTIFESCSQVDSLWKLRAGSASNTTITDHFRNHASAVSDEWLVLWDGDGFELRPFSAWSGQTQHSPLPWWQAYNSLKHNRWENVKDATVAHAVDAAAALFIAIATDPACHAVLAERNWMHSQYASDWTLEKLASPAGILGVTVESTLFSYAIGSSRPDFSKMLAYYHGCTRRFGKWLEAKYNRGFWLKPNPTG